jgi:type I restriction enzyme S subunit
MATYSNFTYSDYFKTELPSHWQEKRLGFLAMQTKNAFVDGPFGSDLKSEDYLDEGVPLIQLNNIRDGKHILRNMKYISDKKKLDLIRHIALPQDIVIAKMAEPVARAAVVSDEYDEYVIVADCVKLTPNLKLVDLDFLIWVINSDCVRENAELVSTGTTRIRINLGELKKLKVPYPSLSEQIKIRKYLDHETAKIDSLIEKQQKLIELLKEKRQAVISHAVTKGLNPDVPMKDSGVEWLGQVPEHWISSKLKYFASIQGGFAFSSDLFIEEGTQVLRIGNVYQNSLSLDRQPIFIANDLVKNFQDFIVKKNDVLMSLTGTLGKRDYGFAIKVETDEQYLLNQRVAKISPNKNIDTDFMVYVLWSESYLTQLYSLPSGTKQANLSNSDVLGIEVVVPSNMEEQKSIVKYIKAKLEKFDEMILKAELAIQLMQERRTALISSAVTGKIDVRNWQNPNHNNNNEAQTELSR